MKKGFKVIRNCIPKEVLIRMKEKMDMGFGEPGDSQSGSTSTVWHGLFNTEMFNMLPVVEQVTGKELCPTYNYTRLYRKGAILDRHTDRPACEYSITLNIYNKGGTWPLFAETKKGKQVQIDLKPGDAMVYKGCDVPHWREPLEDDIQVYQTFFHYVDVNGPYFETEANEYIRKFPPTHLQFLDYS